MTVLNMVFGDAPTMDQSSLAVVLTMDVTAIYVSDDSCRELSAAIANTNLIRAAVGMQQPYVTALTLTGISRDIPIVAPTVG